MSVQKRKCSSCKFFNESPLPGNGWCTHHKRQLSSDVRILVRKGELACRDPWGSDYWTNREDTAAAAEPEDLVRPASPERLVAGPRVDDQITSVTASFSDQPMGGGQAGAGNHVSLRGGRPDDVIVSKPSMLPEEAVSPVRERAVEYDRNDLNVPAHEDQQERVRVIARGNRDAIMKARERVVLRRGGPSSELAGNAVQADQPGIPSTDEYGPELPDNVIGSARIAEMPASRRIDRRRSEQRSGLVSASRGYADPTPPVPPEEVGDRSRYSTIVSHQTDADRFDSVPEVKPDVALPRLRTFLGVADSAAEIEDGSVPDSGEQVETSYDRVLQQAQAIKAATQKERNARVIRNRPAASFRPASPPVSNHSGEYPELSSSAPSSRGQFDDEVDDVLPEATLSHRDMDRDDGRDRRDLPGTLQTEASFDDEYGDDELYAAEDDAAYEDTGGQSRVGPQDSWWRGLHLGFRRRPQAYAVAANDSDEWDDWSDDELAASSDWSQQELDDEPEAANRGERVFSFSHAADDLPATSSAWLRDPRSAEDELIDYELTDEVLETSFADDTDRVQAESWREDDSPGARSPRQDAANTRRPQRDSGFALNDRHDMDAFRAVLFGREAVDAAEPPEPAERRRKTRRHHEPPAVPRSEVPSRKEELQLADATPAASRRRYVEEPAFDIRDFVDQDKDLLDMRVQIAPDIPRACETCRNFRPSESGGRGWCTNDFAFTHRQMVNANDMPCQSSIGCWWLPSDDAWMPSEDLAARDNPTPLTDRLIARRLGHEIRDDRAYPELYVREV